MLKCGVEVVNHVVALIDRVSNDSLHSFALMPRLPVHIMDRAVGTEEGIIHAKLVKPHPNFLRWDTEETWYISSAEDITSKTVLHNHLY